MYINGTKGLIERAKRRANFNYDNDQNNANVLKKNHISPARHVTMFTKITTGVMGSFVALDILKDKIENPSEGGWLKASIEYVGHHLPNAEWLNTTKDLVISNAQETIMPFANFASDNLVTAVLVGGSVLVADMMTKYINEKKNEDRYGFQSIKFSESDLNKNRVNELTVNPNFMKNLGETNPEVKAEIEEAGKTFAKHGATVGALKSWRSVMTMAAVGIYAVATIGGLADNQVIEQTALATRDFLSTHAREVLVATFVPEVLDQIYKAQKKLEEYFGETRIFKSIFVREKAQDLRNYNILEESKETLEKIYEDDLLPINVISSAALLKESIAEGQANKLSTEQLEVKEASEPKDQKGFSLNSFVNKNQPSQSTLSVGESYLIDKIGKIPEISKHSQRDRYEYN